LAFPHYAPRPRTPVLFPFIARSRIAIVSLRAFGRRQGPRRLSRRRSRADQPRWSGAVARLFRQLRTFRALGANGDAIGRHKTPALNPRAELLSNPIHLSNPFRCHQPSPPVPSRLGIDGRPRRTISALSGSVARPGGGFPVPHRLDSRTSRSFPDRDAGISLTRRLFQRSWKQTVRRSETTFLTPPQLIREFRLPQYHP
jgi:hypothetical protein